MEQRERSTSLNMSLSNGTISAVSNNNSSSENSPASGVSVRSPFRKSLQEPLKIHKSNSTSSLFIDSTISSPKPPELQKSIATKLQAYILQGEFSKIEDRKAYDIFDERLHPLTNKRVDLVNIPPVALVEKYIRDIYKIGQLAPEALIMAVAYLDRIVAGSCKLYTFNWRRLILSNLILASKVWEDQAVWNVDFIELFPSTTPHDLGQMEKKLLALLEFDVSLKASQYAQIYFDLRSGGPEEYFVNLRPLDKEGQERLELNSASYGDKHWTSIRKSIYRSAGSYDNLSGLKSPRAVIN